MGLNVGADQVAYRCNLVAVGADGTMVDFAGGHPSSAAAAEVIAALNEELGTDELSFHAGVQYRHIALAPRSWADARCYPPHDLTGSQALWPTGPAAPQVADVMRRSQAVLARFDVDANQVWLWGQGVQPRLPRFADAYGLEAAMVSAVDVVRGLGALTGMARVDVDGATGWYDTNYEGKRDACLAALANGADVFVIHVEATDEAGHAGDPAAKVEALENWDRRILRPLVEALDDMGPWRLLLMPDHATPLRLRTHTPEPVPYLLVGSNLDGPGGTYTEAGVAGAEPVVGHTLMSRLVQREPKI